MKQAVGGTWTLQLMIVFIFLFVGYITLTISYSRTIKTKNETIDIIEKYNGINTNSIEMVNTFLLASNYNSSGICNNSGNTYGVNVTSITPEPITSTNAKTKYNYCIKRFDGTGRTYYYQVTLFFKFNLPVLGDVSNFVVKGSTSNFEPNDMFLNEEV